MSFYFWASFIAIFQVLLQLNILLVFLWNTISLFYIGSFEPFLYQTNDTAITFTLKANISIFLNFNDLLLPIDITQWVFTCLKSAMGMLEQGVKLFRANKKDTRTSMKSFWCLYSCELISYLVLVFVLLNSSK